MIQVVEIPKKERDALKRKANDKYWFSCFVLCFGTLGANGLFFPNNMKIGLYACTFIVAIFLFPHYRNGKGPIRGKYKIIRRGVVKSVYSMRFGGAWTIQRTEIDIELEEQEIPAPFDSIHRFSVYNSLGSGVITFQQDETLLGRQKSLEGRASSFSTTAVLYPR